MRTKSRIAGKYFAPFFVLMVLPIGISRPHQPKMNAPSPSSQEFSPIPFMVQEVSRENLSFYVQRLQNFRTRFYWTVNCAQAGEYLHDFFSQIGLPTEDEEFVDWREGYPSKNIVVTIKGRTYPETFVILCAHYDSLTLGQDRMTFAPGADDNASGTAAVMEIGRILSGYEFDFSVRLVLFSAEEAGHGGSLAYLRDGKYSQGSILGAINLDMIGYADETPEDLDLITDLRSEWLADRFVLAAKTFNPFIAKKILDPFFIQSDHASFWQSGHSAVLAIEDAPPNNPHYHTERDILETLNFDFFEEVTKAALAAVADLAQPLSVPKTPSGLKARSQMSHSLFAGLKTVFLSWNPCSEEIVGYNVYRTNVAHGAYRKANKSVLRETSFIDRILRPEALFYVVTAVDHLGRESNFSAEIRDDNDSRPN